MLWVPVPKMQCLKENRALLFITILIFLQTYNSCARLCLNQETVCLGSTAMKTENCVAKVSKRTTLVLRFFLGDCSLLIKEKFLLKITVRKKKKPNYTESKYLD